MRSATIHGIPPKPAPSSATKPRTAVLLISDLEFGGAQRQVVELANNLDPGRFAVLVCSLADYTPLASRLVDPDRRLIVIRRRFKWDLSLVFRLAAFLRRQDAAVVHSFLFDAEVAARIAGRLAGRTAVIGSERNTDYRPKTRHKVAYALTRFGLDLVVANSHAGARFNSRVFHNPLSMYRVVHNGVDGSRFAPHDGAAARKDLGLAAGDPVVGMFASFKPQKNHPLLLRSAVEVLRAVPRARFLFVGDELYKGMSDSVAFKRSVSTLVDELGLRDRCVFAGNRADVERLYCACDCTVLPSLFEGTPNVVLESMACGVPVVVTDVSDNSYVVREGETGFLVPLDDPGAMAGRIVTLLQNPVTRREMGATAREWALSEFSPKALAAKMAAVYDEAVARKRSYLS
jgi:glycosyltransferase involved in cell wall biosynthesis